MKQFKFKHLLIVLFHTFILRLVAPVVVLLGLPFAKKAKRKTTHYGQDPDVQRYTLPAIFIVELSYCSFVHRPSIFVWSIENTQPLR